MAESSTVARWELALRIKARRAELKMNVADIASHLGFTRNFFSAVENERALLATRKLELLMELLDFPDNEREEMLRLDGIARTRSWLDGHEDLIGEEATRFLGLEQGASEIRIFESLAIAGLLQTPGYMESIFSRDPAVGRVQAKEAIRIRQKRQQEVLGSGKKVQLAMSQAALVQRWGSPDVHRAQLSYLIDMTEQTNLTVRILPFDRPPGPIAMSSTMNILDFDSEHLPSLIWQEPLRSVDFVDESNENYERLRICWQEGFDNALDEAESKGLILSTINSIG